MNIKCFQFKRILITVCYLVLIGACINPKTVGFKTPVDTTDKPIKVQTKQTYSLKKVGVYASNKFDGARLNGFKLEDDSTAILIINPENQPINKSAYYAFNVWSDDSKPFYFTFQYPKGHEHRYIPKIKKDGNWSIIDSTNFYKKNDIVTIRLDLDKTPITVSAQEIQSTKHVKEWYTNIARGKEDLVRISSIGQSHKGRNLPVLDIYRGNKKKKDIIILMTRQHPPEVTGYYAFQEFLTTIIDDTKLSEQFFEKYRILAFPMMNPDGVDMGHWRHNCGGVDTNRDWSMYHQPEVKQTVQFITKTLKKDKARILLGLDFHSTYEDVFYTNKVREGTTMPNFIDDWFKALEKNIPNYQVNEKAGNSTKPVSKGWFLYGHNAVGITYEIGDQTPKGKIKLIGKTSAQEMMKILCNH